jgi:hypothetical protein
MKKRLMGALASIPKKRLMGALASIPKKRLMGALASIPVIAAMATSGSCAVSCPYGNVNDPFPGLCPRYTDLNGDGICDLSQATIAATTPSTSNSDQTSTTTSNLDHSDGANASATTTDPGSDLGNAQFTGTEYHVLPISIMLIGAYLFTYYLFSKGVLNRQRHRRIWNLLVTAGYAGTGVTGVLMILGLNLGVRIVLNPTVTFLHAELAVLLVIGTIIHVHLYWKSLKKTLKVLFSFKSREDSGRRENSNKEKHNGRREKTPLRLK